MPEVDGQHTDSGGLLPFERESRALSCEVVDLTTLLLSDDSLLAEVREQRFVDEASFEFSLGGLAVLCRLRAIVGADVLLSPGPGR
jgi:hypothetical protein